ELLFPRDSDLQSLPSFPTRRSSDLANDRLIRIVIRVFRQDRELYPVLARLGDDRFDVAGVFALDEQCLMRGRLNGRQQQGNGWRSEEHTSELQSLRHLVCRLLLEKK